MIFIGIYCIIGANQFKEVRSQVIVSVLTGIIIISATIINFVFYLKRALKDMDQELREITKKNIIKIGEILELIFFIIFILMPIWQIPKFIEVFADKKELTLELLRAFGLSIASIILLFALNPINIKEKIDNYFKKFDKQNKKENIEEKRDRKLLKKLLLALLVFLSIGVVFRIHDYVILEKISDATDEFLNTEKSELHNKETIYLSNGTQEIEEIYKKNNIILKEYKTIANNVETVCYKSWFLLDSEEIYNRYDESQYNNENVLVCGHQEKTELRKTVEQYGKISYYSYNIKNKIYFTNNDNNKVVNFINNIKNKIFYPIVTSGEYNGIECYVFSKGHVTWYVEKETLLNAAVKMDYDELDENTIYGYLYEYSYENNVSDKNIELPNKENFDKVEFIDYNGNLELLEEKTKEYSLSGTNLKSGEKLIENVEILQEEEFNFLDFTGNSSGIKTLTITSLETYNKFREIYSNLRELTHEDFNYYNVTIAYKDGYKLNYIEEHESRESWILNYIVNSKQTKNKSLLLIIMPKENRNFNANVIEHNKKINISANDAFSRVNENIDEFKKIKNLSEDVYLGLSSDYIEILDNETFVKMDYIKTPVKGNEPICWLLRYTVYDAFDNSHISSIEFYVDATTGKLIGAVEN